MGHGHFCFRPLGKQDLENPSADLTVQFTDAVDSAAAPDREVGHVEWFRRILSIAPAQCQKLLERNRQSFLSVVPEVALHQAGSEAVKACLHGSMGCKEVAGTSDAKRDIEWLTVIFHVGTCPFQHRKRGVTFIEVANLGVQSEGPQEAPAANAEGQLLFQ